jgi:hypothetical protein
MANYIKRLKVMEVAIVDRPAVPKAKFLLFKRADAREGITPFEAAPTAPEGAPWELSADERAALPDSAFLWIGAKCASEGSRGQSIRKGAHHDSRGCVVWRAIATLAALLDGAWSQANMPEENLSEARKHVAGHHHQFGRLAPWEREKDEGAGLYGEAARADMIQAAKIMAGAIAEAVRNVSPVAVAESVEKSDSGARIKERIEGLGERVGKLEAVFGRASIPGQDLNQARESIWRGVF